VPRRDRERCRELFGRCVRAGLLVRAVRLPGILVYKAVNTADSMIGHRTARHEAFGWAAARLDDVLNLVPARLCGALIALAAPFGGGRIGEAWTAMLRDAPKHRSPVPAGRRRRWPAALASPWPVRASITAPS